MAFRRSSLIEDDLMEIANKATRASFVQRVFPRSQLPPQPINRETGQSLNVWPNRLPQHADRSNLTRVPQSFTAKKRREITLNRCLSRLKLKSVQGRQTHRKKKFRKLFSNPVTRKKNRKFSFWHSENYLCSRSEWNRRKLDANDGGVGGGWWTCFCDPFQCRCSIRRCLRCLRVGRVCPADRLEFT